MSDKNPYASTGIVTLERVIATVWAVAWVVVAYGFAWQLALRLFLFFSIPLAFIWVPEEVCMIMTLSRKSYEPAVFVTPGIVRWFGWFVLIGVPVGWLLFAHATRGHGVSRMVTFWSDLLKTDAFTLSEFQICNPIDFPTGETRHDMDSLIFSATCFSR